MAPATLPHFLLSIVKILFFVYIILIYNPTQTQKQQVNLQGKVVDEKSIALAYGAVSLLNTQDSFLQSVIISDENRNYSFRNLQDKHYLIKANTFAYQDGFSEITQILNTKEKSYPINDIVLFTVNTALKDAVIILQKPLIERKRDMLVVNVENSTLAAGNNAQNILEKLPD